jgi:hypothetical protein
MELNARITSKRRPRDRPRMSAWIASAPGTRARNSAIIAAAPSTPVTRSPRATNQAAIGSPDAAAEVEHPSPGARPSTAARRAGASHSVRISPRAQSAASRS